MPYWKGDDWLSPCTFRFIPENSRWYSFNNRRLVGFYSQSGILFRERNILILYRIELGILGCPSRSLGHCCVYAILVTVSEFN
jgi:hypothetical protein